MTFKEESLFFPLFFLFFFPFKFYFQAPLTAPSLLLLEMFHLLRGRQGEGSQNSLKTEKDFAKTGRLLGGKTILDSSVYSCSAPCFAFFLLFSTSSSSPLLAPCPSVLSHILLFISPPRVSLVRLVVAIVSGWEQMVTAQCTAWRPRWEPACSTT